jgi:DNA-binding NarL/FixJ family response regulator
MVKVLIAEAHVMVRRGLQNLLNETDNIALVDEACTNAEVLAKVARADYDVILLDLSLPGNNVLDLLRWLQREKPALRVLVLGDYPEGQFVGRILKTGAAGYLTKKNVADELLLAISAVLAGKQYVHVALEQATASAHEKEPVPNV